MTDHVVGMALRQALRPKAWGDVFMLRRLRTDLPLKVSGPLLLTVPVIVVAVVVVFIGYVQGRFAVSRLTERGLSQVHGRIADHLDHLMALPPEIVDLNAGLLDDDRLDPDDLRSWAQPLYVQTRAFPLLSSISWETTDGRAIWIARYPARPGIVLGIKEQPDGPMVEHRFNDAGELEDEPWRSFDYDPRDWSPYQSGAVAASPTWSDPVEWIDDDGNVTAMALPYVRGWRDEAGELRGVLTAQFTLDDLSAFLANLPVSDLTQSYVLDTDGHLLAASLPMAAADHLMPATDAAHETIASTARAVRAHDAAVGATAPWHETICIRGEPQLMRVTPFDHATGLSLRIVTFTPAEPLMAEVVRGRWLSILAAAVAVGATILLGIALALRLLQPMVDLQQHVARVGAGDFDARLDLNLSPEFRKLSTAINQMSVELKDRVQLRHSLSLAMEVQQSLLPSRIPEVDGIEIAAHSAYCDETGGDYYDFLEMAELSDHELAIAVGDVMGHGIAAAMLMATARGALRNQCRTGGGLTLLMNRLNDLLAEVNQGYRFMTMLLAVIDARDRRLRWASAGHGPPLVFDPRRGAFRPIDGGGLPLGVEPTAVYEEYALDDLGRGAILVAATDGLWETKDPDGEEFGQERIEQFLRDHHDQPAEQIAAKLEAAVNAFAAGRQPADDITYVIAKLVR